MATTTETWQHRDIITNGIRMHYVTQGEGPLIVFLHGFPEFWYSWRRQLPFFAEHGYTAVAPDLRGYNDTDKPHTGYDMPTLLRDIEGLITGLGREKAVLVGHDWGGALAWVFAIRYPQMTERLVILNAPHPVTFAREMNKGVWGTQLRKSWYVFFFQLPWLPEYVLTRNNAEAIERLLSETAVQKDAFSPEDLLRYREAMSKPGAMTAALNYYRTIIRASLWRYYSFGANPRLTISIPTLVLWGEQDVALSAFLLKGLEQWVPNLRIQRFPDSGHWVAQEKADEVNAAILEFLQ
jgi:pimeloyl-ACP methyl ester carboxylesterase